ncbi:alpha/beta hydrolase [Paractinoplanes brasiliensis]|uniref:Alpha/beta hydrolase family protein n=1 Tax=Paractinoplanes brasiliensis TaxID=52695 RepID=A0A4R6JP40_9ACTN|nr:alpha/beta hydrolase [Actinoplanes brasiliensis]TDO37532.1 alpha/beta hydrolase family protein [Actinoplanes brasiliensis]GID31900.1 hypothetical protein Abr02nite_68830 [Actinoplanes brasiliensis]
MRILPLALALAGLVAATSLVVLTVAGPAVVAPAAAGPAATGFPPRSTLPNGGPVQAATVYRVAYRETAVRMLAAGCPYAGWAAQGRQFLQFDPAGDGRAVEVLGDLANATRLAILVPGVDTTLADFDRGLGGVPRRAPGAQARNLYAALSMRAPDTAVIAWLGYDPPEGIGLAAATEGRARDGAAALTAFVRDLLRWRPDAAVTLIGHSYGSVVVGLAAERLPEVRDVVTLGAPGIGVDHAGDLGGARVWSALAPTDWIRRIPQVRVLGLGLGPQPSSAGFGARELPTDGVAGHDFYLVPGSVTLKAVGDVVLSGGAHHESWGRVS